jgi:hypothetical protein
MASGATPLAVCMSMRVSSVSSGLRTCSSSYVATCRQDPTDE